MPHFTVRGRRAYMVFSSCEVEVEAPDADAACEVASEMHVDDSSQMDWQETHREEHATPEYTATEFTPVKES